MFPSYIILKIIMYNEQELVKYRKIFSNKIIKNKIQSIINTELYKWKYLYWYYDYKYLIYKIFMANSMEVVKFGESIGANKNPELELKIYNQVIDFNYYNYCLKSPNLEVFKYGIERDTNQHITITIINNIDDYELKKNYICYDCSRVFVNSVDIIKLMLDDINIINTNSLDVLKYLEEMGLYDYNRFLYSRNIEVVNYAIAHGATELKNCNYSGSLEVSLLAESYSNMSLFKHVCDVMLKIPVNNIRDYLYIDKYNIKLFPIEKNEDFYILYFDLNDIDAIYKFL